MIPCKYYKKNQSKIGRYIPRIYMALNPLSTFLHRFYSGNLANSAGTTFILFSSLHDSNKLLYCRDGPECCPYCSISLLTTVPDEIFFPLLFLPKSLGVSRSTNICAFLGNWSREISPNFFVIQGLIVTVKKIKVKVK